MRITVAICTWNRAGILRLALERMARLDVPAGVEWELLVINNNSTDATPAVCASFTGNLPVRVIFEPRPGASSARNRALDEARGEYILWTDDDGLVTRGWLRAYCEAFEQHPEASVFGGPVELFFAGRPPRWLRRALPLVAPAYGAIDLGPGPVPLRPGSRVPFGPSMAMRLRDHRRFRYDLDLGPSPDRALRGEETAAIEAMLAEGFTGFWVPGARVQHFISPAKQTLRFVRDYYRAQGEVEGLRALDLDAPRLLGRLRWTVRESIETGLRYLVTRLIARPERWVGDLMAASRARGRMRGAAQRLRAGGSGTDAPARGRRGPLPDLKEAGS